MRGEPDRLASNADAEASDRRAFVVLNPQSGAGHAGVVRKRFLEWKRAGHDVEIHQGGRHEDLGLSATLAVEEGYDLIVAAGGDGTVAAVAAAIRDSSAVLGIVPLGTGNIVARDLNVPLSPASAVDLLFEEHQVRRIDAMESGGDVYLMSVGVGISAYVARDTAAVHKRMFGPAAYLWSGLSEIGSVEPSLFEVTVDGVRSEFSATEVSVANSGVFANMMLPWERGVRLDDGKLDVFVVSTESARDYPMLVFNVLRGSNSSDLGVLHLEARDLVEIQCEDALPVQADGEIIGKTPVDVRLLAGAVQVAVPSRG